MTDLARSVEGQMTKQLHEVFKRLRARLQDQAAGEIERITSSADMRPSSQASTFETVPDVDLRNATADDLPFILSLRNHAIRTSTAIYSDTELSVADAADWFPRDPDRHAILIAEVDATPAGYGMLAPYDPKTGYRDTVEDSIYVDARFQRRGVGRALLHGLIERGRAGGVHTVLARVDAEQTASLALHLGLDFRPVGVLLEAGLKFGRRLDVIYLQKLLRSSDLCGS